MLFAGYAVYVGIRVYTGICMYVHTISQYPVQVQYKYPVQVQLQIYTVLVLRCSVVVQITGTFPAILVQVLPVRYTYHNCTVLVLSILVLSR